MKNATSCSTRKRIEQGQSHWQMTLMYLNLQKRFPRCGHSSNFYKIVFIREFAFEKNPFCVILDLGCTRAMGSRRAVDAFITAGKQIGFTFQWQRCWTKMFFANSQTETLEWCVIVGFPTEPRVYTTVDVHENGTIPILFSFPQMMKLGFNIACTPDQVLLTCEALGISNKTLLFSTFFGMTRSDTNTSTKQAKTTGGAS